MVQFVMWREQFIWAAELTFNFINFVYNWLFHYALSVQKFVSKLHSYSLDE